MGHSIGKAMLELYNHDEYNELATKPGPLTDAERLQLLHHKSRLAAALQVECWTDPTPNARKHFDDQWRSWFGEEPPHPDECMRGLHEHFTRPENRTAFEESLRAIPEGTLLNMLKKREGSTT